MLSGDNELFEASKRQEDKFPSRDTRVWQDSLEKVRIITVNYTITADDDLILVDTTSGVITVTLPAAITRRKLTFIKIAGANNVILDPVGTDTVNGGTDYRIVGTYIPVQLKAISDTGYVAISGLGNLSSILANSVSAALRITQDGSGPILQLNDVSSDTTPTVFDANGKIIQGHTTWESEWYVSGHVSSNWTISASVNASGFGAVNYGGAGGLLLMRSNSGTIGSRGIVANDDRCGQITFAADDGVTVSYITGATIYASVDGTPGTGDMPMRLMFATTPDGSSTPVERVRIDNQGDVKIHRKLKVEAGFPKMYFFAGM